MMDAVRVVPEDAEVLGGGLERGEALHDLIAVDDAGRVGILRHAPDALHRRILDVLLDQIHVGAVLVRGDVDHLGAEILRDLGVAVIARHGAEELDLL